jgi:hypothetical protein
MTVTLFCMVGTHVVWRVSVVFVCVGGGDPGAAALLGCHRRALSYTQTHLMALALSG